MVLVHVAIDIHGTILKPTWNKNLSTEYYPLAKQTLQLMSKYNNIYMIMWTSSNNADCLKYSYRFYKNDICFNNINDNIECQNTEYADFSKKFYFDVGIDDRFGFNPYIDWIFLYLYFKLIHKFIIYKG